MSASAVDRSQPIDRILNSLMNKNLIYNYSDPTGEVKYSLTKLGCEVYRSNAKSADLTDDEWFVLKILYQVAYLSGVR